MSASASVPTTGFDRFELHQALNRGIHAAGFEDPRPIQRETLPEALNGRDILGLAQTGTGKTAAFALPMLDWLLEERGKGPRALVLAPTRELATQIAEEIRMLSKFTRLQVVTIFGGVSARNQIEALRKRPEIVVGCPGRVLDLMQQGELRLGEVDTLVLDEADHMFDMGFLPSVRRIIRELPSERQNLLFSATMPKEIRHLADEVLSEPHVVELATTAPAETVDHALYFVAEGRKHALLEHMLTRDECDSAIVFTRTKYRARRLAQKLSKAGHDAVALQGNMSQSQRDRAMQGFRSRTYTILVATDIAARGIDVSAVSHVINFDVPNTPEAYTHRIGRTGRAELKGVACTFVTADDRSWVRATERMIGESIPVREVEGFDIGGAEPAEAGPSRGDARSGRGGRGGRGDGDQDGRQRSRRGGSRGRGGAGRRGPGAAGNGEGGGRRGGQGAASGEANGRRGGGRRSEQSEAGGRRGGGQRSGQQSPRGGEDKPRDGRGRSRRSNVDA